MSMHKILLFTVFSITTICCYTHDNYDINTILNEENVLNTYDKTDNKNLDSYFSKNNVLNTKTTIIQEIFNSALLFFITLIQIIIILITSLYFYFFINKKVVGNKVIYIFFLVLIIIMFLDWLLILKEELDEINKIYLFIKDFFISIAVITIGFVIGDLTMKIKMHKKKIP